MYKKLSSVNHYGSLDHSFMFIILVRAAIFLQNSLNPQHQPFFSLPVFSIWIDVFNEICPRSEKLGCVQFSNSSFVQHTIHHVQHIL
jgi:hypothetical protein